ncbi:VanZ family protein [Bradyrhizobium jicamae]|uniref:VanZ family protein n=1 Tax=Bradyrhizobium jicamae TaxID=280332 RepID=A0ABS5FGR2_9BRAD|nr:VanZ family protein [Bradyrhizobium jicamae]MBR0795978.1 VanZ family protein [Bradyrhizobium jicamae]
MLQLLSKIVAWIALAFIILATLVPLHERPVIAGSLIDHLAAFALLGLTFMLGYPRHVWLAIAMVIGSAFALEALQLLTPDRHARLVDALLKASGGLTGLCTGYVASLLSHNPVWRNSEVPGLPTTTTSS